MVGNSAFHAWDGGWIRVFVNAQIMHEVLANPPKQSYMTRREDPVWGKDEEHCAQMPLIISDAVMGASNRKMSTFPVWLALEDHALNAQEKIKCCCRCLPARYFVRLIKYGSSVLGDTP